MMSPPLHTDPDPLRTATGVMRKPTQTDLAYARLKSMIISGEIGPADQIDAKRLVDVLGFGHTPIREALLRLNMEGIVIIVPKRGVQIVMLSADDITEIYEVISAVEIEAVRLLTLSKPSSAELRPLVEANDRMISAAALKDRNEWVLADEAFHRALLELNPNRRLCNVGLTHRDLAQRAHFVALRMLPSNQLMKSTRQHKRLIKLIRSGDALAAVESHQIQRDKGASMLIGVLRQHSLQQL